MRRKTFTPLDIILSAVIIAFCILWVVLSLCLSNRGSKALISVDNEVVLELNLNEDTVKTVETKYGSNTVCIKDGTCYITDADCRDGICKKHSAIKNKGETIVCLPHKLIAEVK